jgi:hypothetical protein
MEQIFIQSIDFFLLILQTSHIFTIYHTFSYYYYYFQFIIFFLFKSIPTEKSFNLIFGDKKSIINRFISCVWLGFRDCVWQVFLDVNLWILVCLRANAIRTSIPKMPREIWNVKNSQIKFSFLTKLNSILTAQMMYTASRERG